MAILLVLVGHLRIGRAHYSLGSVGVTVFFALSGFLITSLLLEESDRAGTVSLSRFYARRATRLLPALFVMLLFVAPLRIGAWWEPLTVAGYVANWPQVFGVYLGPLNHTWSLSIEEQFYLLWPLGFLAVRRWRNGPLILAVGVVLGSLTARWVLWLTGAGWTRLYYGTDTRVDALMVGCALAIVIHRGVQLRVPLWAPAAALAVVSVVAVAWSSEWFGDIGIPTVVPWLAAPLIVAALPGSRSLAHPVLRWFGARSYGIYLWHYPLALAARYSHAPLWIGVACMVAAIGLAELSWRFVEQPVLRWSRDRVERARRLPGGVLGSEPVG